MYILVSIRLDMTEPPSMVDNALYKLQHERFVSGHNGSTQAEVLLVTIAGPMAVLLRNVAVPWIFVGFRFGSGRLRDARLVIFDSMLTHFCTNSYIRKGKIIQ